MAMISIYRKGLFMEDAVEETLLHYHIKPNTVNWMFFVENEDDGNYPLPEDGSKVLIEETNNGTLFVGVLQDSVRLNALN